MPKIKIAVTLDKRILEEVDQLVARNIWPSRNQMIEEALQEKLAGITRNRLARECSKLDPGFEKILAEGGMRGEDW
ncbi:ribbon-helix-helix domain-containing protein [Desulfuromonas sp. CSMB_57]|uniref:ribbon-helix-helix domain-containing protein n=1 Tax=Desulfuromonas sp. CSMB_57 TaxID=2807629 RepID=UPI0020BE99A0|nr:ribbon-helix-helix domain-containing protein [Desulfuromonas sp. CSMB_57]